LVTGIASATASGTTDATAKAPAMTILRILDIFDPLLFKRACKLSKCPLRKTVCRSLLFAFISTGMLKFATSKSELLISASVVGYRLLSFRQNKGIFELRLDQDQTCFSTGIVWHLALTLPHIKGCSVQESLPANSPREF
jgi:hypothetical protein